MHYDDDDMKARWAQVQADGEAVIAYLTSQPDHEATTVMVSGSVDGDQAGTVIPGTVGTPSGFPYAQVVFPDGSTFGFHAARLAPYTPVHYDQDGTVFCSVCFA